MPSWRTYQSRFPHENEVADWWGKWPTANIAIATGPVSDLAVIDLDNGDAGAEAERRELTRKGASCQASRPQRC